MKKIWSGPRSATRVLVSLGPVAPAAGAASRKSTPVARARICSSISGAARAGHRRAGGRLGRLLGGGGRGRSLLGGGAGGGRFLAGGFSLLDGGGGLLLGGLAGGGLDRRLEDRLPEDEQDDEERQQGQQRLEQPLREDLLLEDDAVGEDRGPPVVGEDGDLVGQGLGWALPERVDRDGRRRRRRWPCPARARSPADRPCP